MHIYGVCLQSTDREPLDHEVHRSAWLLIDGDLMHMNILL